MPSNCDVIPLAAHGVFLFLCHRIGSKDPVANTNDQILPFIFVLALSCSSLSLEGRMVLSSERHACRSSPFRDLLDDAVFLSSRRSLRWVKALRFTPPRSCASNPRQEGRPRRRARSGAASSHSTSAVRPRMPAEVKLRWSSRGRRRSEQHLLGRLIAESTSEQGSEQASRISGAL